MSSCLTRCVSFFTVATTNKTTLQLFSSIICLRSRITIASKAASTFDINKSQSVVSSLSEKDSLSLDEVKSGLYVVLSINT